MGIRESRFLREIYFFSSPTLVVSGASSQPGQYRPNESTRPTFSLRKENHLIITCPTQEQCFESRLDPDSMGQRTGLGIRVRIKADQNNAQKI